ncbi:hypothetical protein SFRURICE_006036, partial [Spodoptera frugiperda]
LHKVLPRVFKCIRGCGQRNGLRLRVGEGTGWFSVSKNLTLPLVLPKAGEVIGGFYPLKKSPHQYTSHVGIADDVVRTMRISGRSCMRFYTRQT